MSGGLKAGQKARIVVCRGPTCGDRRDSRTLFPVFERLVSDAGLRQDVEIGWQSCYGRCSQGPNVYVEIGVKQRSRYELATRPSGGVLYNDVTFADAKTIVEEHILQGTIVKKSRLQPGDPLPSGRKWEEQDS